MDFDRCLSTSSNSRYYDPWYSSSYNPAANTSAMPHQQHGGYSMRDYPSPAPSDPSPGPRSLDLYASSSSADSMVGPFSQIESSIGPARSTRHRSSISRPGSHARRLSLLSGGLRDQDSLQSPSHLQETLLPRTDSPTLDRYEGRSPLLHSTSPTLYQPNTPVSVPSPFSHSYDQARRSRTRSMDKGGDHDFRAHSPALSTHSGQTSSSSRQGHVHALDSSMTHADSRGSADIGGRPKKKERHHKHKLRDQDRKAICVYHLEHPNARQEDIGSAFGVERSTISKILKDKDRWLNISDDDPGNETSGKHRPSKFPEVEFEMVKSLQLWADRGENITDQLIRQRALEIAKSFGMAPDKFKGSSGWIENFKHRHDIRRGEWLKAGNRSAAGNSTSMNSSALGGSMNQDSPTLSPYDHQHHRNASSSESDANSSGLVIDPALQQPGSPLLSHLHHSAHHAHSPHSLAPIQHSPTLNTLPTISHHSQALSSLPSLPSHSPISAHPSSSMQVQYGVPYGAPLSPLLSRHPPPPTLAEAENALNILLDFLDRSDQQNEPIAKDDEREVLTRLKVAMFQRASGIAYER